MEEENSRWKWPKHRRNQFKISKMGSVLKGVVLNNLPRQESKNQPKCHRAHVTHWIASVFLCLLSSATQDGVYINTHQNTLKMEAIPLIYVSGNAVLFLSEFRFMNCLSSLPQHTCIILMFFWYISLHVLHFSYFHLITPRIIFSFQTKISERNKSTPGTWSPWDPLAAVSLYIPPSLWKWVEAGIKSPLLC